jgi:hypothetical protein
MANLVRRESELLLYTALDGAVKVGVLFKDETAWLTQKTMAELFGVGVPAINKHLKNIFESGELDAQATISKMEMVRSEGGDDGLDRSPFREQGFSMSSAAVKRVIDLASELSEDERRVVVDAIAPKESVASLADEWTAEIERRANLVRSGRSEGKPANVFDRLESKLKAR